MKIKKRYWIVGAVLLALSLLAAGAVMGLGPPSFCRGPFHQRVLAHIDDRVEDMGLSKAQMKKYQLIRQKLAVNLTQAAAKRWALFDRLYREINKPNPDLRALTSLVKQKLNQIPVHIGANLDLLADFYDILDEKQKARFLKKLRRKMKRVRQFHPRS